MKLAKTLLAGAVALAVISGANAASKSTTHASKTTAQQTASVNINKADAKTLSQLKGIGQKRAEAIVAYRQAHGKFKSTDDLVNVRGISKNGIAALDGKLTV